MYNSIFDNFDGEILDTYIELAVNVSYDINAGKFVVCVGDEDITDQLDNADLQGLEEAYKDAYRDWREDRIADKADWEYEQEKDRRLDEVTR